MLIQFVSSEIKPKPGSLVVCAGTITCFKVDNMGSGFLFFKHLFSKNNHYDSQEKTWKDSLQFILNKFHNGEENMPSYIRIAQQDGLIGGVATVPTRYFKGLTQENFASKKEQELAFFEQYKKAVKLALLDAIQLDRPLFIQPLGIGVYGWDPEEAAQLFVEVIKEVNPAGKVSITIPLFDTKENSKDQQFKKAFQKFFNMRQEKPASQDYLSTNNPDSREAELDSQQSSSSFQMNF